LKLEDEKLLSTVAFNFNLRRYSKGKGKGRWWQSETVVRPAKTLSMCA